MTAFLGVSANIYFAKIINSHSFPSVRADIANNIYLGASKIFPYVDRYAEPLSFPNLWINTSPLFWIGLSTLIILFFTFTSFSYVKNSIKIRTRRKYLPVFLSAIFIIVIIVGFYNVINESQMEPRISSLFNEVLMRDPSPAELTHWKNEIHEGRSFDSIRDDLRNSDERQIILQIGKIYSETLNRDADPTGLAHWKNEIHNGKSLDSIRDEIKKYPESIQKINEFYNKILHRNAEPTGLIFWTNRNVIDGLSFEQIEQLFKNSPEAKNYNRIKEEQKKFDADK